MLKSKVLAKFFAIVNLDTELFYHFDLPKGLFDGCSILRNFVTHYTTADLALLENVNVIVSHSPKEGGAAERSRASTDYCNGFLIRRGKILGEGWISDLRDSHLFEDSNGEFLKSINLNCTLFGLTHIAVSCAKLRDRAKLTAGKAQGVV